MPIWFIGQMTIFLKKQIEHRKDHLAVGNNMKDQEREGTKTKCLNTQRWNPYINTSTTLLVAVAAQWHIAKLIMKFANLNPYEKSLLAADLMQMILCLVVPLSMYAKNKSMFQHLIYEILQIERSENFATKSRTKSKPEVCTTYNIDNTTIKLKNEIIMNQVQEEIKDQVKEEPVQEEILDQVKEEPVQEEISDQVQEEPVQEEISDQVKEEPVQEKISDQVKEEPVQEEISDQVKEEPNQDYYSKCLPYHDQRVLLAAARLKNAGFQLSNNTPEDGNCLIHALKDQMR